MFDVDSLVTCGPSDGSSLVPQTPIREEKGSGNIVYSELCQWTSIIIITYVKMDHGSDRGVKKAPPGPRAHCCAATAMTPPTNYKRKAQSFFFYYYNFLFFL